MRRLALIPMFLVGCAGDPDQVQVALSPSVISSLDGSTTVTGLVLNASTPLSGEAVHITIDYTDRNGMAHTIDPVDAKTDDRGAVTQTIKGLTWDGNGTIHVTTSNNIEGTATFSVLDRTPPKVTILPPTTDNKVGPGLPLDVQVKVTDEIGVSDVVLDGTGGISGTLQTLVASGATETTITFRTFVSVGATTGPSIELHALASDLSGNLAAAAPVTLTVDPTISIATPAGLTGALLVDGTQSQLASPRSIVASPKDNQLYIADVAGTGACNPSCVWKVDPTSGAITSTPVYVGTGTVEGVAVDATGDNLYISDRQNKVVRMTWNGTAYASATTCDDTNQQKPQSPYHLVADATLGTIVVDDQNKNVQTLATCSTSTVGVNLSAQDSFDAPRGIALDPAGAIYVSDFNRDRVSLVSRTNGALTTFASGINNPYGVEWLAGGTTQFADSLMIASTSDRIVVSAKNNAQLAATYLRNNPMDMAIQTGTMYIVTAPSANNRGRLYKVSGF